MKQFITKYKGPLLALVLFVLISLSIIFFTKRPQQLASSKYTIDSLIKQNKKLADSILVSNKQLVQDSIEYVLLEDKKSQNHQYYDKKINHLNSFTVDSVYNFFANRYK